MVGASKILTVSYGTFSCTLEGFDEPFSTMKAIAEYFRDLAADDRYFGAEPPTPDAEMLHRIAEREIHRRVEAKINENGVILRARSPGEAGPPMMPALAPQPVRPTRPMPMPMLMPEVSKPLAGTGARTDAAIDAPLAPTRSTVVQAEVMFAPQAEGVAELVPDIFAEPVPEAMPEPQANTLDQSQANASAQPQANASAQPQANVMAEPLANVMAEPQPEAMLDANSVAAKLSRLRAAVASARGAAQLPAATGVYADDNYSEDNHAVTIAGVAGTSPIPDFGYALPGSLTAAFGDDPAATEAAETEVPQIGVADAVPEVTATKATGSAGHSAELGDDDAALLARIADRADVSEAAAVAVSGAGSVAETSDMLAGIAVSEPLAAPAEDTVAVSGADAAEVVMAGAGSDDESSDMLAGIAVSEPLAGIFEDATGAVVDAPAGPVLAAAVELEVESATGVTIELADAAEPAKRVRARVVKLRRSETTEIVEIFAEQVTEADAAADPLLASIGATIGATGLSPEDEADLFSELAEAARDSEAEIKAAPGAGAEALPGKGSEASAEPVANAEADAMPERSAGAELDTAEPDTAEPDTAELVGRISAAALEMPAEAVPEQGGDAAAAAVAAVGPEAGTVPAAAFEPQEDAIARLFEQTNSELEGAENRRRLDAISHLRAAVVATEADREVMARSGETDAAPTDLDGYRDDLAMVVRPRRPEAGDAPSRRPIALPERMAPLVLVSAQRIDRPAHAATEPSVIRPRRVMTSALALDLEDDSNDFAEEDQDTALKDSSNFAEFAERIGATGLSDLLEAAAAYAAYVEGRQSFSRPQIMKRIAGFAADDQFSREDGLRSFGMLLRQGKIQKVKRGQFAIAKTSRYIPEARRMAQ